ncbi:MAG: hypothetical protein IT384_34805 [Deltaproteobacteria bacterium]|nr:hypothetical protein [Deltaproteobacteria bacterium]
MKVSASEQAIVTARQLEAADVALPAGLVDRLRAGTVDPQDLDAVKQLLKPGSVREVLAGLMFAAPAVPVSAVMARGGATLLELLMLFAVVSIGVAAGLTMRDHRHPTSKIRELEKKDPELANYVLGMYREMQAMHPSEWTLRARELGSSLRSAIDRSFKWLDRATEI